MIYSKWFVFSNATIFVMSLCVSTPGYNGEHVLIRHSYGVWVGTEGEVFVGDTQLHCAKVNKSC